MSNQAILFKNFTDQDFTWSFDSVQYTFKAGQEMYLEEFKARHFAKHLIDRECHRNGISTDRPKDDGDRSALNPKIKAMEALCFPSPEPVSTDEALNIEETKKEVEKKKSRKTKKVEEEEFPDLKNDE